MKSEIRKDYIQDKYVIIAPKRGKRPHELERPERVFPKKAQSCMFCARALEKNNITLLSIPSDTVLRKWDIAVIPNKYPAVTFDNPKAYGKQEIVVETASHTPEFHELSEKHIQKIFNVYAQRTQEISKNQKIEYILIFKNTGGRAGASIEHSHSQIFATSFLPPHLLDKSQKVQEYKLRYGRCVYCDVIKKEKRSARRIYHDSHITAFAPYASEYNYEAWIMPIRHLDNVTDLNEEEISSFAKILKIILKKINNLNLPYNFYFHQVIHDEDQHLYLKVVPRGSVWAGVEIGSGVIINPISPEEAAQYYRNKLKI